MCDLAVYSTEIVTLMTYGGSVWTVVNPTEIVTLMA